MTAAAAPEAGGSRVSLEIPDWPGLASGLELSMFCGGAGASETAGTWEFSGATAGPATVAIDWSAGGAKGISLIVADGRDEPVLVGSSQAPDGKVRPEMVLRLACGPDSMEVPFKVTDTVALERYYQGEDHQDEYVIEHPFFLAFHKARLEALARIFEERIPPGSKVLDVGSGYSIFFLCNRDWEFDITCCDLHSSAIEKMRGLCPGWTWEVADAMRLPFDDASFGTVYAGEIIEHVPDVRGALAEWRRVLEPGGTLILTTPNRERMLAVANRRAMPVHPEHVLELSPGQARALLAAEGFDVLETEGIYLELFLNWHRPPGKRVDLLTARYGMPEHERYYKPFMRAGRLAPSRAFDLIFVCKKQ